MPERTFGRRLLGEHGALGGNTYFRLQKFNYDHVKKAGQ